MARIIKVRCNGADQHVNEVDLDSLEKGVPIARAAGKKAPPAELPERYVLRCKDCTAKVIVTRQMILDYWRREKERG